MYFLFYLFYFLNFLIAQLRADTLGVSTDLAFSLDRWEKIIYTKEPILDAEFIFLLSTNREFFPEKKDFLTEILNKEKKVFHFLVQIKQKKAYLYLLDQLHDFFSFSSDKNFFVFIHGDGRDLPKMIENGIKLKTFYPLGLMIFDYPSYNSKKNRLANYSLSRKNIIHSLEGFHDFCLHLQKIKQTEKINHLNLFSHSLGGFFMKKYQQKYFDFWKEKPLFDQHVWMLSAVKGRDHFRWINSGLVQKNYVFFNKKDMVLRVGEWIQWQRFLGLRLYKKLAKNTVYVDLTRIGSIYHTPYDKAVFLQTRSHFYDFLKNILESKNDFLENYLLFNEKCILL